MIQEPSSPVPTVVGVQVCTGHDTTDYSLSLTDNDVTVAEVFDALGIASSTAVDGQLIASPASTRATDALIAGAKLSTSAAHVAGAHDVNDGATGSGHVEVSVVAGLDSGRLTQLPTGLYRLGPHGGAGTDGWYLQVDHPQLLTRHAAPWHMHASSIEAVVESGVAFALAKSIDPEPGSTTCIHRPPRPLVADVVDPIELIGPPVAIQDPMPLSWATLLAPIPVALMMAFFFRPMFALFAAMGPIMSIGRWYESRRRFRRDTKARNLHIAELVADLDRQLRVQSEGESQRRWLAQPHIAELWRRSRSMSVRLWERRPAGPGYLVVTAGVGPDQTGAQLVGAKPDAEIHDQANKPLVLRPVPHTIDLATNTGVGVHGARAKTLAVARSVVMQLVTLQGPADVRVGVLATRAAMQEWDWIKWLPHLDSDLVATSALSIAKRFESSGQAQAAVAFNAKTQVGEVRVIVVDDPSADVAAIARAAQLADQDVRFVVVAESPTMLPAMCSSLIRVDNTSAEIATPELNGRRSVVCPVGIERSSAVSWARALTALTDPELTDFAAGEEAGVSLSRLVNFTTVGELASRWADRAPDAAPATAVGLSSEGPFRIDLTQDGPHCLIAGTTGSGKSELLRSLVMGLAVECPPEHLNFVLVDFKGGGAFDAVDQLPHVAGLITDLDQTMVERAISSLRAELHRRETIFRKLGVSSYDDAVVRSAEPLARLVIVIDEFAALATDYAEQMASVIDLAARGRSLGMHLVLATQRPTGVVDQKIRANTNLRVALRVQDAFDSQDVIGVGDAADIDRKLPGRAIFVVGGDAPVEVQTAFSGAPDVRSVRCEVRAHLLYDEHDQTTPAVKPAASALTELEVLLGAITQVSSQRSYVARPLWSEPLPEMFDWIDLGAREIDASPDCAESTAAGLPLGLVDIPDQQTQQPWRWDPDSGALAIYGASADCASKTLVSVGAAFASMNSPADAHLYVIDGDAGSTAPLHMLAHTGAYISLTETDRIERALRLFETEMAERRSNPASVGQARLVLLIDNLASLLSTYDDVGAAAVVDRLGSIARDGTPQRIHLVLTARTVRDIGHRLAQQIPNRLVLSLADPSGYLTLGLKSGQVGPLPAMRAVDLATRRSVQLVEPPELSSWSHDHGLHGEQLARPIRAFPEKVSRGALGPAVSEASGALSIPVGVEAADLGTAALVLQPAEHALVVASNGMGRSTMLGTILHQLDSINADDVTVVRVGPANSWILGPRLVGSPAVSAAQVAELEVAARPTVVVVDDAERLPSDLTQALERVLAANNPAVRIIAATTLDYARSMRSWTSPIRAGGTGVLIGGQTADGELFKVRFGQVSGLGTLPGRGHLVIRGRVLVTQFAGPGEARECT